MSDLRCSLQAVGYQSNLFHSGFRRYENAGIQGSFADYFVRNRILMTWISAKSLLFLIEKLNISWHLSGNQVLSKPVYCIVYISVWVRRYTDFPPWYISLSTTPFTLHKHASVYSYNKMTYRSIGVSGMCSFQISISLIYMHILYFFIN